MTQIAGSGTDLLVTTAAGTDTISAQAGVIFTGTATTLTCIWAVTTSPNSLMFTDYSGLSTGSITVSGATLSGSLSPACTPTPYGCFPPCLTSVVGTVGGLDLEWSDGTLGSIAFDCP